MKHRHTVLRDALPVLWTLAVLLLLRVGAMALNPLATFLARVAAVAVMVWSLRAAPTRLNLFLFAILPALVAWLGDLTNGDMAFVNGIAALLAGLVLCALTPKNAIAAAALCGLCIGAATALGVWILLTVSHEMTPGAALLYAASRQIVPTIGCLLGALIPAFAGVHRRVSPRDSAQ